MTYSLSPVLRGERELMHDFEGRVLKDQALGPLRSEIDHRAGLLPHVDHFLDAPHAELWMLDLRPAPELVRQPLRFGHRPLAIFRALVAAGDAGQSAAVGDLEHLLRHLVEEWAGDRSFAQPADRAVRRLGEDEIFLRPRDADEREAAFFFELL